jgi:hypothetical protein
MSQGWWLFGTEEVVSQKRREVWEAGKKWIEFDVEFSRGDIRSGTLRVDPETRLPVFLAMKSYKCLFDYPADGPSDIYAVGVPATITIDDRMPSEACLQVLRGMAASRARIGGFRLVVTVDVPNQGFGSIVWRKGDRWRIDSCSSTGPRSMRGAKPPDGLGWGDPAAQKLGLFWVAPKYICDGKMVYQNTVTVADEWRHHRQVAGIAVRHSASVAVRRRTRLWPCSQRHDRFLGLSRSLASPGLGL